MLSPPFPFTRHGARFSQRPARDLGDLCVSGFGADGKKHGKTLSTRRNAAEHAEKCSVLLFRSHATVPAFLSVPRETSATSGFRLWRKLQKALKR